MIIRTFRCGDCKTDFDTTDDPDPDCPTCAGATHWVPKGGHIKGQATKNQDAIMRDLASAHGLTDMNTQGREGDTAAPPLTASQRQMLDMAGGSIFGSRGPQQGGLGSVDLGPRDYREKNLDILAANRVARPVEIASETMRASENNKS